MTRTTRAFVFSFAVLIGCTAVPAFADSDALLRGQEFATVNCGHCHALDWTSASPFDPAPPFREIANFYPVEGLAEAFAEGITVGHAAMPEFVFAPEEIGDLLLFMDSFTKPPYSR